MRPVVLALRALAGLLASLVACIVAGCGDASDFQRQGARWSYLGEPIEGADAASLRVLDAHHAKDREAVWWCDTERRGQEYFMIRRIVVRRIVGADAASFAVLAQGYARDRAAVYLEGRRLDVADPAGFEVLEAGFARDGRQAYHLGRAIAGSAGAPAFKVLDVHHADDGRRIWHASLQRGDDGSFVHEVRGAERGSFAVLEAGWARDTKHLYFDGRAVGDAPDGFQPLDRGYVRTAKAVHYLGAPVAGADAASFEVLSSVDDADGADARDARRRYRLGQRLGTR